LRTVRLGDLEQRLEKKEENEMKEYRFSVTGMMCPRCVAHVKEALEAVNGVEGATVDLASESATVICQSFVEEKKLKSAIVAAGYGVK
jgi:Cu2+-exporting ATPase